MPLYKAPIDEYLFIFNQLLKLDEVAKSAPRFSHYDGENTRMILEAVADFAEKELAPFYEPINSNGQYQGDSAATYTPAIKGNIGHVTLPKGYAQAHHHYVESGLQGIVADPAYHYAAAGQPHILAAATDEFLHAANTGFALPFTLNRSVYLGIFEKGSAEQKARYLPGLSNGLSCGVMAMTEGNAGSDISQMTTYAIAQTDGNYAIQGEKIYITGGDNEFTSVDDIGNIIHLVLARVKDADTGKLDAQSSMFIVPKILEDAHGKRQQNSVGASGVEHKMGMADNATCTMLYEGAWAEMIGTRGKGIATMFAVMNDARLGIATQALGIADVAYQKAYDYATNPSTGRRMGAANAGRVEQGQKPALIIDHEPVRELLLRMRSTISGARMLRADIGLQMDLSHHKEKAEFEAAIEAERTASSSTAKNEEFRIEDEAIRRGLEQGKIWAEATALCNLMTNVVKAHITDAASAVCDDAIQVFGGIGYTAHQGIERHWRDVRVSRIYEGTNQIQAVTLYRQMKYMPVLFQRVEQFIQQSPQLHIAQQIAAALESLKFVTTHLSHSSRSYNEFASGATSLLDLIGIVAIAYEHGRAAMCVHEQLKAENLLYAKSFLDEKIADAEFYVSYTLSNHLTLKKKALISVEKLAMKESENSLSLRDNTIRS